MELAATMQRPLVLCVDDEPQVLEGLRDTLRRSYDTRVATGGVEALELLRSEPGAYATVISDMRMPVMAGSTFLREARRVAPDAVRILLTGYADMEAAIRSVNDGQVFRFLRKPCEPEELMRTCAAALVQHRLLTAERVLLEETLRGSVQALADVLSLASPAAFGRAARVKQSVIRLAQAIGLDDRWELEVAALLAEIGAVTLPAQTLEKLHAGAPLADAELAMVDRVPAISRQILENIPRLDAVLQILDGSLQRIDGVAERTDIPLGSRVLRIALDYDDLNSCDVGAKVAIAVMRSRNGAYDPGLLETFATAVAASEHALPVREVSVAALPGGATLAADVRASTGGLLVARGQPVTGAILQRLSNLGTGAIDEPLLVFEPERFAPA